jgi:tRNA-Thr(GGU) m(6)t(6)A37 methyltransferase TsaA
MKPICFIKTPFKEKFGVPRQPMLVMEAWGKLVFKKDDFFSEAFRGIENFSHLWPIFDFHQIQAEKFNALIRPPRFDSKKKFGVFATRSPHRPNKIGLSVVKFEKIEETLKEIILWVSGVDLVDGTPILDIKPYLPYVDSIDKATANNFSEKPQQYQVIWECSQPQEANLIEKIIGLDPRPGHEKKSQEEFGVYVAGYNVRFKERDGSFVITKVTAEKNNLDS